MGLSVGEVAHGPGQVVGGHAWRASEAAAAPAVHLRLPAALHRHVGQRRVLRVVAQRQREGGLVERLVEAGEGLAGVGGAELGHRQVAAGGEGSGLELAFHWLFTQTHVARFKQWHPTGKNLSPAGIIIIIIIDD